MVFLSEKFLNVLILDKTVLNKECNEHRSFNWLLTHEKYFRMDGEPYAVSQNYLGFFPLENYRFFVRDLKDKSEECTHPNCLDSFDVILNNLISNAIRFADLTKAKPFIKVTANYTKTTFTLTVEDNGIGIPNEHQEKIFEMFYRGTEQVQGTGIGLYILKESLDILNGTVEVSSIEGKGSNFTVKIPNKAPK